MKQRKKEWLSILEVAAMCNHAPKTCENRLVKDILATPETVFLFGHHRQRWHIADVKKLQRHFRQKPPRIGRFQN
jgi:hypothetical protein